MCPPDADLTPRAAPVAAPAYAINDAMLDMVLQTLPPMAAGAPAAWHRTRRAWVRREIASHRPADALQALLAGWIVTLRHTAADLRGRADPRTCSEAELRAAGRMADQTARLGREMERLLGKRQREAVRRACKSRVAAPSPASLRDATPGTSPGAGSLPAARER